MLGFVGRAVSCNDSTRSLWHKRQYVNKWVWLCSKKTLFYLWKEVVGWIWPKGPECDNPWSEVSSCGPFLIITEVKLLFTYLPPIWVYPSVNWPFISFAHLSVFPCLFWLICWSFLYILDSYSLLVLDIAVLFESAVCLWLFYWMEVIVLFGGSCTWTPFPP